MLLEVGTLSLHIQTIKQMAKVEIELIWQFLASNWYDREEDDDIILDDVVNSNSHEYCLNLLRELKRYSKSNIKVDEKTAFISKAVWRYFNNDKAALIWFRDIINKFEIKVQSNAKKEIAD